jgi:hypothetical protein
VIPILDARNLGVALRYSIDVARRAQPGTTTVEVVGIARRLAGVGGDVLCTRASADQRAALVVEFVERGSSLNSGARY